MRRKTIYYYFLLSYVLVFIGSFLVIDLWTSYENKQLLIKNKETELYDSLNVICVNTIHDKYNRVANGIDEDLKIQLRTYAKGLNCTLQIIDFKGNILYSSQSYEDDSIPDFNIRDFGESNYKIGKFYNYFDDKVISVYMPITENLQTRGYAFLHYDLDALDEEHLSIQNTVYLTFLFIFMLTLIILITFTFTVFIPIKKISIAAREYAKGNFTYEGLEKFNSDNEIGRLGLSLKFMADELNTMEVDERKFIANISHDFRSPLTSIKGYVEAMKDGTIPYEMQDKYLDIVLFETERLTKLTENILTLNKWDSKGNRLDITSFNIYTLIRQIANSFEGKCEKKKLSICINTDNKYYMVSADKDKISQVIYNLIDNAIKFSHSESEITVNMTSRNDKVFISVADSGIGIPKESLSKIWDRFYKTDLSRGKDKTGSGLGLSITREIILAHEQNINVVSTEGVGTKFIFTLKKS